MLQQRLRQEAVFQAAEKPMATVQWIDLITTDPDVRDGQPCIGGTGVRVTDIAMAHLFHRRTPDEISSDYDLSSAQVHAALAFYYEHKTDLDDEIRRQVKEARKLKDESGGASSSLLSG
jgi:uncharacterized protein (DUF433 family)